MSSRVRHKAGAAVATLVVLSALLAPTAQGAPGGSTAAGEACYVTVVGQARSGEWLLSPMTCGPVGAAARLSVIAVHYVDFNFGGASLSIQGGACNGGWLNLPGGWQNTVSSTWSACTSTHFDLYSLGGASEALPVGGGNLSALHDRTNSVRYT
jgi:hypothetical protein